MAVMTYFEKLRKTSYFYQYIKDENLMGFLESEIRKVNPAYSLQTTLTELAEIDQWKSHLKNDTFERLKVAPSPKASIKAQLEEIKKFMEFKEGDKNHQPAVGDNFQNEVRSISYNLLMKGDNVTLNQLGYLMLHERWQREGEEKWFLDVGIIMTDLVKIKLHAIAEGAAFAYYIPFLENLLESIEKNEETENNIDDLLFYAQMAHQLYTGSRTIGTNKYSTDIDFIEAMYAQAEFSGIPFYENLALALPAQFGAKKNAPQAKEILAYCQQKIKEQMSAQCTAGLQINAKKQVGRQKNDSSTTDLITTEEPKDWQDLQNMVATILSQCGMQVEIEKKVITARGEVELDVYAEENIKGRTYKSAFECKHWRSSIPQTIVHGFRTVVGDFGCNAGYIITTSEFQKGAFDTASFTNIELLTWDEFQHKYFDTWMDAYFFKKITDELDPLMTYTEPLLPRWYGSMSTGDQTAYQKLKGKYDVIGLIAMGLFSTYSRSFSQRDIPKLPLSTLLPSEADTSMIPSDIFNETGYTEFLDKFIAFGKVAIAEFRLLRDKYKLEDD